MYSYNIVTIFFYKLITNIITSWIKTNEKNTKFSNQSFTWEI